MNSRPHVAVLWGGTSSERNISEKTGSAVTDGLRLAGYPVSPIDAADDFLAEIAQVNADVAFIALHGEFGEDGRIQRVLEDNDIPYTGSGVRASKLAMDKAAAKDRFIREGLETPKYRVLHANGCHGQQASVGRACSTSKLRLNVPPSDRASFDRRELDAVVDLLGLPLVVKPVADGSSIGISMLRSAREWDAALEHAGDHVLIEEFIDGRELTVAVMCGAGFQPANECNQQPGKAVPRALPIIEMTFEGALFDYSAKYNKGTVYTEEPPLSAEIEHAVQDAAVRACTCLGCTGVARVDLILSGDGVPYILEVNTIPGMTATSLVPKAARCAGIGFQELVSGIVKSGLAAHSNAKGAEVGKARKASA